MAGMVEVRYRGTFGDNLFQYCFGRILAERWGHELVALPLPWFPETCERVSGARYLAPFQSWSGLAVEERQLGMLLRGRDLETPVRGRLVLYGWFQRWELYRDHMTKIRKWLALPDVPAGERLGDADLAVVLRTRRPEAWNELSVHSGYPPSWSLPVPTVDRIKLLVERIPHERLILYTDAPHSSPVMALQELRPVVRPADSFSSWNQMRSAKRMAFSICHASDWWAATLSGAEELYPVDPWPASRAKHCQEEFGCGWRGGRPLGRADLRVVESRWHYEW